MRLRFALIAVISAILVFVPLVGAAEYVVGVESEYWVRYGEIRVSWNGTGTVPKVIQDAKKIEWAKMKVQNISGTAVTMTTMVHYNNGTEIPETGSYDVKTGPITGTGIGTMFLTILGTGLQKGDHILNESGSPTINDTVTKAYCGSLRSVNFVDDTSEGRDVNGRSYRFHLVGWWDQTNGVMLEVNMRRDYEADGGFLEYSFKATETNIWSPDVLGIMTENIIYIAAIVIIVIVIAVGVLVIKKRKYSSTAAKPTLVRKQPN